MHKRQTKHAIQHLSIQYLALSKDWINKNVASSEYNSKSEQITNLKDLNNTKNINNNLS